MKIAIIGQADFGKAAFEAFTARGDEVAAVFCALEKPGAKPDALRAAAEKAGVRVHQFKSLRSPEAHDAMRAAGSELIVMAYVTQFAPQSLVTIPRFGAIQYHPSLLPRHRGPSAIGWAIAHGEKHTGLTIFRPTDGLDEGPVILQKTCDIGPDDTLADVYFKRLFPLGVTALLEAADLVVSGQAVEHVQDEAYAGYEGWMHEEEAQVHWAMHVDVIYNLVRACNPSPGAWTWIGGAKVRIYDARRTLVKTHGEVQGAPGTIASIDGRGITVNAHGGRIEILVVRPEGGAKVPAAEFAKQQQLAPGQKIGTAPGA
ncbi:methionyl-tRNA formyltransferase [Ramlibacter sp. PS4R-6]|uniref:methionyl-tRNA formyltransferase n=1 Tax=Ramlibacter sp. PS4R-6 TaxID=3133438 RepID=UPI0030B20A5E